MTYSLTCACNQSYRSPSPNLTLHTASPRCVVASQLGGQPLVDTRWFSDGVRQSIAVLGPGSQGEMGRPYDGRAIQKCQPDFLELKVI
jgi:hypothetical protein